MTMKFVLLVMLLVLTGGAAARADDFSERMDRVKEGMYPPSVVMLVGQPLSVRETGEARLVYFYRDSETKKSWTVTFVHERVDSVDEL
jgi:hypothetical protein